MLFSTPIRYAQCWEDAQLLLDGLNIQPGDRCLSIASAGDNSLALLLDDPAEVVAIDMSSEQLACLALRIAAYRVLTYGDLLELLGVRPCDHRLNIYEKCRPQLDGYARSFWDDHPQLIKIGFGCAGRFEQYLRIFRTIVLPLTQSSRTITDILTSSSRSERRNIYHTEWDNWRWRTVCSIFASRFVMSRLGRDSSFFDHVDSPIASRIIGRFRETLVSISPATNPYMQWILTGRYLSALPPALQADNFQTIRKRLNRVIWHHASLADYMADQPDNTFDGFNFSDVFEYMDQPTYHEMLEHVARIGTSGARLGYWNLFVDRSRPPSMADSILPLHERSASLSRRDRAFFYERFVLEEIA